MRIEAAVGAGFPRPNGDKGRGNRAPTGYGLSMGFESRYRAPVA